jgi:iron complex outermembrane receptor protein
MRIAAHPSIRALVALALAAPGAAAPAAEEDSALEEVVVSARKRLENLQDVPDSITAFSAAQIEERRLNRISDAISLTPNVHMISDQDAATNIITVRGIGTNRNLASAVAFVVDGVVLPDSDAFTADLTDLERIEILKGPQGGLYGRNAIAGVINLTTRRPSKEFEGELKAGYSSGETADVFGAISGPLVQEKLLGRLTVKYHDTDGLLRNSFNGENMDYDRNTKVTGRLIWEATDALTFDLRGSHYDQDSGALWFSAFDVQGTTGGTITEEMARVRPNQNEPGLSDRTITDASLVIDYDAGFGTFSSITAYDDVSVYFEEDLDATPLPVASDTRQTREVRGVSQELRFTSPGDKRFRYILGAYAQNTDRDLNTFTALDVCFLFPLPICPTPTGVISGIVVPTQLNVLEGEFKQSALFAQANYDITDALELSVALRYDEDQREQLDVLGARRDEATFSDFQPKVSLSWKPTPGVMLYTTYAEGYKSGAFNPPPSPTQTFPLVVKQEGTDNFEVGVKSSWMDHRVTANASVYYTEYSDAQIFQLDLQTGGQVAINANAVEIRGGELELATRPMRGLELSAALGYTDSEFTDFNGTGLYNGNRLPNSPKSTFNASGRYEWPLSGDKSLVARLDYHRVGGLYFAEDNVAYQPSYETVDAQFGLEAGKWSVTLWGKNIFEEHYVTSVFMRTISPAIYGPLGLDFYQTDPGAVYGAEFRWRF